MFTFFVLRMLLLKYTMKLTGFRGFCVITLINPPDYINSVESLRYRNNDKYLQLRFQGYEKE